MSRTVYFVRRLLLVIPTFLCITFVCFGLCQFIPGGPVEQAMMHMRGHGGGGEIAVGGGVGQGVSEEQRVALRTRFGFDQPLHRRYWRWLVSDRIGLQMMSYKFPSKTAWQLIRERFAVSLIFGIPGFVLTYLICVPLGIVKALRDGSAFDFISSVVVFVGYAIPPFALGMVLKILLCGTVEGLPDRLPSSGFVSDNFDSLSAAGKVADVAAHMVLPVCCYVIGNFAILTLLMKNALLEQIGQDYVRTVLAKGASVRRAIWGHAVRNALIPVVTGIGTLLTVMFSGSVLIERVFEIHGMGSLSLDAIVGRDYAVFMGILSLTSLLVMLGNIVSDLCYVIVDPRISFD